MAKNSTSSTNFLNLVIDPHIDFKSSSSLTSTTPKSSFSLADKETLFDTKRASARNRSLLSTIERPYIGQSEHSRLIQSLSLVFLTSDKNSNQKRYPSIVDIHQPKLYSPLCNTSNKKPLFKHILTNLATTSFASEICVPAVHKRVRSNSVGPCSYLANTSGLTNDELHQDINHTRPQHIAMDNVITKNSRSIIIPSVHSSVSSKTKGLLITNEPSENPSMTRISKPPTKSVLLSVPIRGSDGSEQIILREVHQYPSESIKTVTEKKSYLSDANSTARSRRKEDNVSMSDRNEHLSVMGSDITSCSSFNGSDGTSNASFSYPSDSLPPFRHLREDHNCSGSEISSNFSEYSDLSVYGSEYSLIRNAVSKHPELKMKRKGVPQRKTRKSYIESRLHEQDSVIQELKTQKEDTEIQLHKITAQQQNLLREKEILKEQLDIAQMKATDVSQRQHFEILKQKAAVDGQLHLLNRELDDAKTDKTQLQKSLAESITTQEKYKEDLIHLREMEANGEKLVIDLSNARNQLESELSDKNEKELIHVTELKKLTWELDSKNSDITQLELKTDQYSQKVKEDAISIQVLRKELEDMTGKYQLEHKEKLTKENMLMETHLKLDSVQSSQNWYQEQLLSTQKCQSDLQTQLSGTKNSLISISADADKYKLNIKDLNDKLENNRINAVKEKSALVSHLEEIEADMKKREAIVQWVEETKSNATGCETRMKRLEEDGRKYQRLRIEMGDLLRQNESTNEELRHKMSHIKRLEIDVKHLMKELVISREKVNEKDVLISSYTKQLLECKKKFEDTALLCKEKETALLSIKEEKLSIEAMLKSAEADKVIVNETVMKLKEDIMELSSNFHRMKHDLAAKDKRLDNLANENAKLLEAKHQIEAAFAEAKLNTESERQNEVLFNEKISELAYLVDENEAKIQKSQNTIQHLENEKDSLIEATKIRDSQIEELMPELDSLKQRMQTNEAEFKASLHSKSQSLEDSLAEITNLTDACEKLHSEKVEYIETAKHLQARMSNIEQDLILERKSKSCLQRNCVESAAEIAHLSSKVREMSGYKTELDAIRSHEEELEAMLLELSVDKERLQDIVKIKEENIDNLQSNIEDLTKKKLTVDLERQTSAPNPPSNNENSSEFLDLDLETTKESVEHLQKNYNEAVIKIAGNSKELSTLVSVSNTKDSVINSLESSMSEISHQKEQLEKDMVQLQNENLTLKQSETELWDCRKELKMMAEQCDNWKAKYESIQDFIPEKDTSSSPHVWSSVPRSFTTDSSPSSTTGFHEDPSNAGSCKLDKIDLSKETKDTGSSQCKPMMEDISKGPNNPGSSQFEEMMLDLQKQFGLASEALQMKDKQIIDLTHTLSELQGKDLDTHLPLDQNTTINLDRTCLDSQVMNSDISTMDTSTNTVDGDYNDDEHNAKNVQILTLKEKITLDSNSFHEKEKQYESNLQLLTRKLREHMKGRRAAERQLEVLTKEKDRLLSNEKETYKELMDKYMNLGREYEVAGSRLTLSEQKEQELGLDLDKSKELVLSLQDANLKLGEKLGFLNELENVNTDQKAALAALEETLKVSVLTKDSLSEELLSQDKEFKVTKEKALALESKADILEVTLKDRQQEADDLKVNLDVEIKKLEGKDALILDLQRTLEERNEELETLSLKVGVQGRELLLKDDTLSTTTSKIDVLERQIKLLEDQITALSSELELSREVKLKVDYDLEAHKASCEGQRELAMAREESQTEKIDELLKEKIFYQSQTTDLKRSLHLALSQIKRLKSAPAHLGDAPSPPPVDTKALQDLIKKCSEPPPMVRGGLGSLSERLYALRRELLLLQEKE